jgi:hypothetical protein
MAAVTRASEPDHNDKDLDLADAAEVVHFIRNRLAPLSNALQVIRLAAGNDPRILAALDVADRQVTALAVGMRDHG